VAALEESVQIGSRHAVFINRFAGSLHNDFLPFLEDIEKQLKAQILNNPPLSEWSRKRLNTQLKDVRSLMAGVFDEYNKGLFGDLEEFSSHEAAFEAKSIEKVVESKLFEATVPTDVQAWAAVTSRPLILGETAQLLRPYVKDWELTQIKKVENIIRTGFFLGKTTDEISRATLSTMVESLTGKGGLLTSPKRVIASNRAMVRTAVNHTSTRARQRTSLDNSDIVTGLEIVVTFDSRTSTVCRSRAQSKPILPLDSNDLPPYHLGGCRTTVVPILDKRFNLDDDDATRSSKGAEGGQQVKADQTYYTWLKTQPKSFIKETLGKSRSELFLNGGLTSDEFSKLSVDKLFRPLTLDEMRTKDPMSFDSAGI
jgi:hypothetical protein